MLIRYKFKWTDADQDVDNKLTEKEFLAFRHPEQSEQALDNMLSTIINSLGLLLLSCTVQSVILENKEMKDRKQNWYRHEKLLV